MIHGECQCGCHNKSKNIKHIVPCCVPCPKCNKNMQYFALKNHEAECKAIPISKWILPKL
jgi:hypothetical protein